MRKQIIYLFIAIFTFTVGTILSVLFYSATTPSVSISRSEDVIEPRVEQRPVLIVGNVGPCSCHQGSDVELKDETTQRAPINGGVLNGKAINLPKPAYPAIAKSAHASGAVVVEVLINERGCVVSARAISGHPLLQQAAVEVAYKACFTPTRLSGEPVKVKGVITYNFVMQ